MNDKLITYRSNALDTTEEDKKPKYGLIRMPKRHKHKHDYPRWKMIWYLITFQYPTEGSLWRCKCGSVFRFTSDAWIDDDIYQSYWKKYGGQL